MLGSLSAIVGLDLWRSQATPLFEEPDGKETEDHRGKRDTPTSGDGSTTTEDPMDVDELDFDELEPCSLKRCIADPYDTDLSYFHNSVQIQQLTGSYTTVKRLAKAIHGEVLLCDLYPDGRAEGTRCVAKKMPYKQVCINEGRRTKDREAHFVPKDDQTPHPEDPMAEIGVLTTLKQQAQQGDMSPYLLRMLDVFVYGDSVLLMTEHVAGGELFEVVAGNTKVSEDQVMRCTWQILCATQYLHSHHIAHRDISPENLLITQQGDLKLMDFGHAVRTHSICGCVALRYFGLCGKSSYRPPECYVPKVKDGKFSTVVKPGQSPGDKIFISSTWRPNLHKIYGVKVQVVLPEDAVPGQECLAEAAGYEAKPVDIFSIGACMFVLAFKCMQWDMAIASDSGYAHLQQHGTDSIRKILRKAGKQPLSDGAMDFMVSMLQMDAARRPTVDQCLSNPWLQRISQEQPQPL